MSRLHLLAVPVVFTLLVPAAAAQGRMGDRAWVECVWERAPGSAANWLAMAPPRWTDDLATPAERRRLYRIDIVRAAAGGERITTFRQFFLDRDGRMVRAARGTSLIPARRDRLSEECRAIAPDGTLADA